MKSAGTWLLRSKAALAQAVDYEDALGLFGLYVKYDEGAAEGSVSLRHTVLLATSDTPMTLSLFLRPENITHIRVSPGSRGFKIDRNIVDMIPDKTVMSEVDIITLDIMLHTPGRVICPLLDGPIQLRMNDQTGFIAFSRLCQATSIRLYLGKNQAPASLHARLQSFAQLNTDGKLRTNKLDLRRMGAGPGGAQEYDWVDIHPDTSVAPPCPPTYEEARPHPTACHDQASKKRPRKVSSSPPACEETHPKRVQPNTPPPGSPTEVNTPSTRDTGRSSSKENMRSNIPPTRFVSSAPVTSSTVDLAHVLGVMLKQMPPEIMQAAFHSAFGSLHTAPRRDVDLDISPESAMCQSDLKQVQTIVNPSLEPLAHARIASIVDQKLDEKLELLLSKKVPIVTDIAIERKLDGVLNTVEHGHALIESEFRETADDAVIELHQARDQGIVDVESTVQRGIEDLSDHVHAVVNALGEIEATTAELKRELRSLLVRQSLCKGKQPRQVIHATQSQNVVTRRCSI